MRIDRTRQPEAKARTLTRRTARLHKSAALFLALAFEPPAGSIAGQLQGAR